MDMENSVVLRRLRSSNNIHFANLERSSDTLDTFFSLDQTQKNQHAVFKLLIEEEASLVLEYNALRALLRDALTPPIKVDKKTLLNLVKEALDLAQVLTKKYALYINEHPGFLSKRSLEKHQDSYIKWIKSTEPVCFAQRDNAWEEWLSSLCAQIDPSMPKEARSELTQHALNEYRFQYENNKLIQTEDPLPLNKTTRTWWEWLNFELSTDRMNPRRLYLMRERRFLVLLIPIIKSFENCSSWIIWADGFLAPFLAYLNMVFFLPRLIFNLCTLFDNVFDEKKMKSEAKHLDTLTRFMAQWNRLWPQIMNDFVWAISGVLMCFVFIGTLQPLGIYLSVAMQFYDVVLVSIRLGMDFNRFNQLTAQYKKVTDDPDLPLDARYKDLHPLYCMHLESGMRRERSLLYLAWINAAVLFVAMSLALPFSVAISPLLPLVGAVIALIMTVVNFQGRNYLNTPESKTLENLLDLGYPKCPVSRLRSNSLSIFNPIGSAVNLTEQQTMSGLSMPTMMRAQSMGNPPQFFSSMIAKSQSGTDLKALSSSPSPTGINESMSMDDLCIMGGGIIFR